MNDVTPRPSIEGETLAVVASRLESVARKMQNTLFRTGRSGVLNAGHDFSCVILTADHRLLAAAESLPIHVMVGPDIMARSVAELHPAMRRGDAFLHNSPYHGNSHPADHCIIVPVIGDDGVHRFTVLAKAHQADCGNSEPTTYMGHVRDVYQEGALIFPAVQVQRDYRDIDDIVRMCRMRIRVPEQWWGDYLAAMGAARIGERELLALGAELGWDALERHCEAWFAYSEERMVQAIRRLPAGRTTVRTAHDPFPGVPDGIPVQVTVEVDPEAARITVDLRDNPDCQPCGLNLSEACSTTAAMVGIYNSLLDHTVPPNAGSFQRVEVLLRENCATGIPRHPYSCSVATTNLADRVSNAVQRAIAELADGFGMAETGPLMPAGAAVISGRDPRNDGAPFVNQLLLGVSGGAAAPVSDAWVTIVHVGNAGMCHLDSVEVDERKYPIHIRCRRLVPDSEGAGRHRGAPGIETEYGPIDGCRMEVFYTADGTINPSVGVRGGLPGGVTRTHRRRRDGSLEPLPACTGITLEAGETVHCISAGGGGYGPPHERPIERVLHDLAEGWVTPERTRTLYGVVLDAEGRVDIEATEARRRELHVDSGERDR